MGSKSKSAEKAQRNKPSSSLSSKSSIKRWIKDATRKWISDFTGDKPPAKLLRTSDPKFRDWAGLIYRGLGIILCAVVIYLWAFDAFKTSQRLLVLWLAAYLIYLIYLEIVRVTRKDKFDSPGFRGIRIATNIIAITYLINIPSTAQAAVGLFYAVPIFAAIIYFTENRRIVWGTLITSMLSLLLGGIVLNETTPLSYLQFLFIVLTNLIFSLGFYWFYRNVMFGPDIFSNIAVQLHQTINLQELLSYIIKISIDLTRAERVLIIITDPVQKVYVTHAEAGFELREGYSIERLAEKCTVIASGQPFNCPDLDAHYGNRNIYSTFFKCEPKSVIATPLFNKEGKIIGVLNVTSDKPNRFDGTAKDQMVGFSYIVSSAIENSLAHRQVRLREIQGMAITRKFAKARDELEIFDMILQEVKAILPHTNCVIHRYESNPKSSRVGGKIFVLNPVLWDANKYNNTNGKTQPMAFRYGQGLAGHALKLHEPILVNNVKHHPWFVKLRADSNIRSLLACPLFDPNSSTDYGTISIFSDKLNFFTQENEFAATSLAHQASLAISKIRELEEWQEQGGVLRKILNEVRYFDFGASEQDFCHQLSEAATKLLGFKLARIRLLDDKGNDLYTVAVGGLPENEAKKLIGHKMPFSVLEPFMDKQYQAERSYIVPHGNRRWKEIADKYFYIPAQKKHAGNDWKAYDALLTPIIGPSGQTIGILSMDLPKEGMYPTKNQIEPIGLFASMAGWAIELSRYQRGFFEQKDRTKSFIDTLSDNLSQGYDFQTLGNVAVKIGATLISAEGCNLFIVRENEIVLTHSTYLAGTDYLGRRKPICSDPGCGLTGWVAKTGKPLLFNREEYKKHPAWAEEKGHLALLQSRECRSVLLVPLLDEFGNSIGVLSLENKKRFSEHAEFDDEDKRRVTKIAQQLAKALDRIGKFETIKKWESKGLEDDLHFLINWYRFGVLAHLEQLESAFYRNDLEKARGLLPELLRNARNSVYELKALHTLIINECLEADNLKVGLERLIDAWKKRVIPAYKETLSMRIILNCSDDVKIETALRNTMLRIASEALSNAIFHSGIIENPDTYVKIDVKATRKKITLRVADNGVGARVLNQGFGIDKMNQLSKQVNSWGNIISDLDVKSKAQKGTTVTFSATYTS